MHQYGYESYILSDIAVLVNNRYQRLGKVKAKNSSKVPKDKSDILEIRTNNNTLLDINDLSQDEIELILSEISEIDILAYEELNQDYYHYRGY